MDGRFRVQHAPEQDVLHPGVGLHVVGKQIVHGLVAAKFQTTLPRAVDGRLLGRDHEEVAQQVAVAGRQMLAFVGVEREAVEAEAIDQKVRGLPRVALAHEVSIQFPVDDRKFLAREHSGVLVQGAQRLKLEHGPSPCVRADAGRPGARWRRVARRHRPDCAQGVELVVLPPYSPELQPAQCLWPVLREAVANDQVEDLAVLDHVLGDRCNTLTDDPDTIRGRTLFYWWPALA